MLLEHESCHGLGTDAVVALCDRVLLGHGCFGDRMLLEHERYSVQQRFS